jgi:hypothetical protein
MVEGGNSSGKNSCHCSHQLVIILGTGRKKMRHPTECISGGKMYDQSSQLA